MATARTLSAPTTDWQTLLTSGMAVIWAIALAKLLLHIYFNNRYGYFRDEFDYISCGDHLGWGYVDQPPLIPFLIHINRAVLGDSLRSIRFLPALASSLLVMQTALIAREFGGKRFSLLLSAVAVVVAPQYLSNGSLLGTNILEPTLWMACAYFVILAIKRNDPRYWIWLGGVGAFLIFLPNLLWNFHYHWPFLELMRNIRADGRDVVLPAGQYFFQQILLVHPPSAPIWITGLIAFFASPRLKPYRVLGLSYLVCYAVFFVLHGKIYYLAPIYPMLLAAGAVVIESAIDRPRWAWLKPTTVVVLLASGAYFAPIVIPVFSPEHFLGYARTLPFKLPVMEHSHERVALPQWYADQFGWEEIVAGTAVAWNKLDPKIGRASCR